MYISSIKPAKADTEKKKNIKWRKLGGNIRKNQEYLISLYSI